MFTNEASVDIFSSREQIRNQLTEYAKKYLGLENVDLYKTSFVSYIIDMMSILSTNQLFYSSTVYKEQFFLQAQLLESVYNLAKWIGYNPEGAVPSEVQALFTIPLGFKSQDVNLVIPDDYEIKAGNITFKLNTRFSFNANITEVQSEVQDMEQSGVTVRILQNRVVNVQDANGFSYPVQLTIVPDSDTEAQFLLPFTQVQDSFLTFQVPDDLEFYQFYSKHLTDIDGQIASQEIYVVPPNAVLPPGVNITDIDTVDEFNQYFTVQQKADYKWEQSESGVYTLTSTQKKYVWTSYDGQAELLFGNGVLGKQPDRGSTIFIILYLTKGESGNVIPGSITSGDPIFWTDENGRTTRIAYTVTNPSSAVNGADSQSIEEIKSNALVNLRARERLVSDTDYSDFDIIVKDTPLQNTTPVLKRSDLKINEFVLFSELIDEDTTGISQIVPTRNIVLTPDSTSVVYPEFYIPRGTIPNDPDNPSYSDFQTIFSMNVNLLNNVVGYEYLLKATSISSVLDSTDENYNSHAYILIPNASFSATVNPADSDPVTIAVNAVVDHIKTNDIQEFRCKITTPYNGETHLMTTELDQDDPLLITGFSYNYLDITGFPMGTVTFEFIIEGYIPYDLVTEADRITLGWGPNEEITKPSAWLPLSEYSCRLIIRKDISEFMISSIDSYVDEFGNTKYRIHNVPVILNEYLQLPTFDSDNFELVVLQKLISNIKINQYRMLNDFINIKFPDTNGLLTNMKYNEIDEHTVISRHLTSVPISPNFGDIYIINGSEGYDLQGNNWNDYINYLARWNGARWILTQPITNEFVEINDTYDPLDPDQSKRLIFTGSIWFEPVFNIPLRISLRVRQDPTVTTSTTALVTNIRTELVTQLASSFGLDKNIDRSEIIKIVRSVDGVEYVELLEPQVDIKFSYQQTDLTEEQLLDYTPQLVAITEDTITVKVIS